MSHVAIRTGVVNGRKASAYASYLPAIANPNHFDFSNLQSAKDIVGGFFEKILGIRKTDGAKVMLKKCDMDFSGFAEVAVSRIAHRLRFQANEVQYLSPEDCKAIGLHWWTFGGTIHTWDDSFLRAQTLKENPSQLDEKTKAEFDRMQLALIWLDVLVGNYDRHTGNYGTIYLNGNLTLFAIDHGESHVNENLRNDELGYRLHDADFFFGETRKLTDMDFLTAIQFRNTRFSQARRVLDILCNFWSAEDWDSIFCDMPESFKPFFKPLMERHNCLIERYKKYLRIG